MRSKVQNQKLLYTCKYKRIYARRDQK